MSIHLMRGLDSPHELSAYHPLLNTSDLEGGVYVAADAVADQTAVCRTLAKLAQEGGARYVQNCVFENLQVENGRVAAVDTSLGTIQCEFFVNCAGMWSWALGQISNPKVRIPTHPVEHFYLSTKPLDVQLPASLPTVRDYDSHIYIRKMADNSFLMGFFEKCAKPIFTHGVPSRNWRESIQVDWDHCAPFLDACLRRIPKLRESKLQALINAPDNFTADGEWILGETPEIDNYFVGAGQNGNALQAAGGLGHALAHWIIEGEPEIPLLEFDVRRFVDVHNNRFLYERVKETVGRQFAILHPQQSEYKYGRRIRCSPLYSTLSAQGAVFGSRMCFERPLYFDKEYKSGDAPPQMPPGTYWKPLFFDNIREEYQACREGVALIDMSSYSKFQLTSANDEVLDFLQHTCSNDVNIPVGHITNTGMHNERGGYENDCMLVRQAHNNFFMVCPTKQQTRIADWMRRHLPTDYSVQLTDVTSMFTVLLLIGPKSKELLSQLTDSDLSLAPSVCKAVSMGHASDVLVLGSNSTNTGEPSYSLYIPSEYAVHVYDEIMRVGKDYGIRNAGYLTLRQLRIEKFIPFYYEEIDSETTPLEIGRQSRVKFEKNYFIGKFAMQKQLEQGITKRLVQFTLSDDHDAENDIWPFGGEPVFRNGVWCGTTTSAGYAFTLERRVALGFITNPDKNGNLLPVTTEYIMNKNALYQIDIAGQRFGVHTSIHQPTLPTTGATISHDYHPTLRQKAILQAKH